VDEQRLGREPIAHRTARAATLERDAHDLRSLLRRTNGLIALSSERPTVSPVRRCPRGGAMKRFGRTTVTVAVAAVGVAILGAVTSLPVPDGFLEAHTAYKWEVLAIERSGNQTLSSGAFRTR
jgi:hypothetical protein